MDEPEFDVIVIGGGIAGSVAAITLAKSKFNVLLVERAETGGSKNISGGILWGNDLAKVIPNWEKEAPIERKIISKRTGFLTDTDMIAIDYKTTKWKESNVGYSVLRVKFDDWLLKKAEEAGATVVTAIPIEKLAIKGNKVTGVIESNEVTTAHAVVIADGVNSRLMMNMENLPGYKYFPPQTIALGIKEVYKLDEKLINERFAVNSGEGISSEYVLGHIKNVMAGGFLYTNKSSISLGVVINLESLIKSKRYSYDIIEEFKTHPFISPLIDKGELVEYSAHPVPEGGEKLIRKIAGNGYLVVGDAAGFAFSNGLVIQGMNYAIRTGYIAAKTLENAKTNGWKEEDFLKYTYNLRQDNILQDFHLIKDISKITWNSRMYHDYPYMLSDIMYEFLGEYGKSKRHMKEVFKEARKRRKIPTTKMLGDAMAAWRNL